jgi:chorismate synthase
MGASTGWKPPTNSPVERPWTGLADEVRYSILPILIGDGIQFFEKLDRDIALHLMEVKAYKNGVVGLRYEVRGSPGKASSGI